MSAVTPADPVQFEVMRNALGEATEEMALALRRSAYSTNIKTRNDFSCAFFDRHLRVAAQAFSQPVHLGSLVELVPRAVRTYGPERLRAGDMLVANDPYDGGVHLNDITVIAPVFCQGTLFGYVANLAHHVDVGGGAPASVGAFREVFQEGVIIPAVRLVEDEVIIDDVFRLILAQIRSKRETAGDLRAQVAANVTGRRRLAALVDRVGLGGRECDHRRAARLHRAPDSARARPASSRGVFGRRVRRQRRLHRSTGPAERAGGDRRRRRDV